jgi:hypothetical protein
MPDNIYPEPGAIQKLTGGPAASSQSTAPRTAPPEPTPTKTSQARKVKPTSIYLTSEQLRKLDDLAYTYNGRTGKRINRNDIVRHLVDTCDIGSLQGLKTP